MKKFLLRWLLRDIDPTLLGSKVIDQIIKAGLIKVDITLNRPVATNSHDVDTTFVWSMNAPEQIGEAIKRELL